MIRIFVTIISIILISKALSPLFYRKKIIINFVKAINKVYISFIRQQKILDKIIIFSMMTINSYLIGVACYYKVQENLNLTELQGFIIAIVGLLLISMIIYFSVGTPMLILGRVTKFIASIRNEEISWKLIIGHGLLIMYSCLIIVDKIEARNMDVLILVGLGVAYFLNLQVLFRITINPMRFTLKSSRIKEDKNLLLGSIWIGAFLLVCVIILNLFLGIITINSSYPGTYINEQGGAINNFDLFYYTLITFTTIGYGDISPIGIQGKVMAIIIAFTSVVCLVVMMSSILSLKDKLLED